MDIQEINDKYEEKGYFQRIVLMFKGFGKPRSSGEFKQAVTELQRQAAPLIAVVSVVLFVAVVMVVSSVAPTDRAQYEVTVAEAAKDAELEEQKEEEPPEELEPPPEDIEITVDTVEPAPVNEITPVAQPPAEQVTVKPAAQDTVAFVDSPVKMKSMTGSRTPGSIGRMTSGGVAGWGDPQTEAAAQKVLWWLKANQDEDGGWTGGELDKTGKIDKSKGIKEYRIANAAFAVLTYLAHGEYPGAPSPFKKDFGPVVEKAVNFILSKVWMDGKTVRIGSPTGDKTCDVNEYTFAIATYALCEAYGMTKNPNCKEAALKCLERIVKSQSVTGGWDYKFDPKSNRDDLSLGGWALQALKAGKMAGLHPEGLDACIKKAVLCLQKRNFKKDHFTYTADSPANPGLTATGCLAMQLLGYGSAKEVRSSLEYMKEWTPSVERGGLNSQEKDPPCPQYYCYYATQCKYQAGMKPGAVKSDEVIWKNWNAKMKALYPSKLRNLPEKVKDSAGKEHAQGFYINKDVHSTRPVMDTCLVALQLMVYYRYLPTTSIEAVAENPQEDASKQAAEKADVDVIIDL